MKQDIVRGEFISAHLSFGHAHFLTDIILSSSVVLNNLLT